MKQKLRRAKSKPRPAPAPTQSFCGSDMRAAYYEGTALTGSGQSLGLLEYLGTDLADLDTYYANAGQTNNVPINSPLHGRDQHQLHVPELR